LSKFCVYIHARPDGSPFYVGKGTLERARKLVRRNNPYHNNIVSKYGRDRIIVQVVRSNLEERDAFALEVSLIAKLKESGNRLCNMTAGGEGQSNPSEETRRRMSEAQSRRTYSEAIRARMRLGQLGRKHLDEVKAKIGARHRGKVLSESTKEKLRAANLGKKYAPEVREKVSRSLIGNSRAKGNRFSEELRTLLSKRRKGIPWSEKRRIAYELRWGGK
jgi:hypothetical protein